MTAKRFRSARISRWNYLGQRENACSQTNCTLFIMPPALRKGNIQMVWDHASGALIPLGIQLPSWREEGLLFGLDDLGSLAWEEPLNVTSERLFFLSWNHVRENVTVGGETRMLSTESNEFSIQQLDEILINSDLLTSGELASTVDPLAPEPPDKKPFKIVGLHLLLIGALGGGLGGWSFSICPTVGSLISSFIFCKLLSHVT